MLGLKGGQASRRKTDKRRRTRARRCALDERIMDTDWNEGMLAPWRSLGSSRIVREECHRDSYLPTYLYI